MELMVSDSTLREEVGRLCLLVSLSAVEVVDVKGGGGRGEHLAQEEGSWRGWEGKERGRRQQGAKGRRGELRRANFRHLGVTKPR